MTADEDMPCIACHFRVTIDSVEIPVANISRLTSETLPQPGAGDMQEPGRLVHRHPNVTLRRALGRDRRLYDWRQNIVAGNADRRQVSIYQLSGAGGETVGAWTLEGAWPCKWAGPAFDAAGSDVAMEEVELVFDRLVWR